MTTDALLSNFHIPLRYSKERPENILDSKVRVNTTDKDLAIISLIAVGIILALEFIIASIPVALFASVFVSVVLFSVGIGLLLASLALLQYREVASKDPGAIFSIPYTTEWIGHKHLPDVREIPFPDTLDSEAWQGYLKNCTITVNQIAKHETLYSIKSPLSNIEIGLFENSFLSRSHRGSPAIALEGKKTLEKESVRNIIVLQKTPLKETIEKHFEKALPGESYFWRAPFTSNKNAALNCYHLVTCNSSSLGEVIPDTASIPSDSTVSAYYQMLEAYIKLFKLCELHGIRLVTLPLLGKDLCSPTHPQRKEWLNLCCWAFINAINFISLNETTLVAVNLDRTKDLPLFECLKKSEDDFIASNGMSSIRIQSKPANGGSGLQKLLKKLPLLPKKLINEVKKESR